MNAKSRRRDRLRPERLRGPGVLIAALAVLGPAGKAAAQEAPGEQEVEALVVQATRSGRVVADEPIRVEVIDQEEIAEKVLMTPGAIAMLVNESGGVRVQVTSPGLGAANIRIQGMRGRYSQLLADGLPLYGGQASSIGLLQIPPTDLGQVEVIKGAASALYGPSALGGVINLVSRRPGPAAEAELLANATNRNGQDLTAYASSPITEAWRGSIVGGFHRQTRQDLDDDGWIDMSGYERWTARPRLFWTGADGASAFLTVGAMKEERQGGTLPGRTTPDGTPFPLGQDSRRFDAGLVAERPVRGLGVAHFRASGMTQKHRHLFGDLREDDRHQTLFAEASLAANSERTSLLAGAAFQADRYRSDAFPGFDYTYTAPAVFVQAEHDVRDDLTLASSARLDAHSEYGTRVSPRLSLLYRPGPWSFRASVGRGFYAPTPFVEEIEAAGLSRLEPISGLEAETAQTASVDGGYSSGPIEAHLTLFASEIRNAVRLEEVGADPAAPDRVRLVNTRGVTRNRGAELLLRYRWEELTVTGSYVHVEATEPDPRGGGRRAVPLTPRHTGGFVAMWEREDRGRIGFEAYYTGRQDLEDNPYRATGRPYVEMGLLGELILGEVRLFLNLENILDVRQTKHHPAVLPRRAADGTWSADVWAPTDGFVVNGGVRLRFGGA